VLHRKSICSKNFKGNSFSELDTRNFYQILVASDELNYFSSRDLVLLESLSLMALGVLRDTMRNDDDDDDDDACRSIVN